MAYRVIEKLWGIFASTELRRHIFLYNLLLEIILR